ncbi:MAG: cyclic nucleotide-binding domain-containing protein, partial [Phormidium sp.]
MTQAVSRSQIQTFLAQTEPFNQLAENALQKLSGECQLLRYRIGQPILQREVPSTQVAIVYMGQVRVLGYDQRTQTPVSLYMAGPGKVLGWAALVRGEGCETAIASDEVICITIPSTVFLSFINQEPVLRQAYREQASISEVFELLSLELQRRAIGTVNLKELTTEVLPHAKVVNLPSGQAKLPELDPDLLWMVSSGMIGAFSNGSRFPIQDPPSSWTPVKGKQGGRLLGVPLSSLPKSAAITPVVEPEVVEEAETQSESATTQQSPYDHIPY